MDYSLIPNTNLKVSKICLGTMTFGQQNTEIQAHQQLDYAVSRGINFIDTAEMYPVPAREETTGTTEQFIGNWLKDQQRDKLILATKIAGPSRGLQYIRNPLGFSKDNLKEALEKSLDRLKTDYIDLYQLHWPERQMNMFGKRGYKVIEDEKWKDNIAEVLEGLNDFVKQGKIRHIGLSNEAPWGVMRFLNESTGTGLPRVKTIQNPYSLLNRLFEVGLSEMCYRENVGLLAYSPLGFGILTGKHNDSIVPNSRLGLFPSFKRYLSENCFNAARSYSKIAQKYNISLTTMALAFVNAQKFVTSNIIGATTLEQLKENIDSVDYNISNQIIEEIEQVHQLIPNPAP